MRGLTIGALSRATGIPASTLRTWERRYGVPSPLRTAGNQRLYDPASVAHLQAVARALGQGLRPAQVLAAPPADVARLVAPPGVVGAWLDAVRAFDPDAIDRAIRLDASRRPLLDLLETGIGPFLVEVGRRWESGELTVAHEHLASERVRAFLSERWHELSRHALGAPVVCATLPGHQHDLGLHLAATAIALAGRRPLFLGRETPVPDIVSAAVAVQAHAVAISVAAGAAPRDTAADLAALRDGVTPIPVWAGGAGAPAIDGVTTPPTLAALSRLAA